MRMREKLSHFSPAVTLKACYHEKRSTLPIQLHEGTPYMTEQVDMNHADAISVVGMQKAFGSVVALENIDLTVPKGSVMGLLGPNGAGKTTFVRILTTLLSLDAGEAFVAGYNVARNPSAVRSVIGLAGQYAALDENLTGQENLEMVGRLYHLGGAESK